MIPKILVLPLLAALVLTGCKNVDRSEAVPTNPVKKSEHGSHMAPPQVKISQVERSGPGPEVGDRWTASIGLNVCGQFLEPPSGIDVRGVTGKSDGTVVIEPTSEAEAGHNATLGSYIESVGAQLSTGSFTLPAEMAPPEIEVKDEKVPVAGQTFTNGQECAGTPGKVVVWVYSPEADATGKGLVTVAEDPENLPFFADGVALVVTFTPDSSLPTLPPSAAAAVDATQGS